MFFFMFWLGLVLIELAFSAGKMPWLLTISIPVNVMIARYLGMLWDRKKVVSTKRSVDVLFYVFIVAILTLLGVLYFNWFKYPAISIPYLQLMLIVLLAVAVVTIPIMRYRSFSAGFYTLFCASLACLVTLNYCAPFLGEHKVEPLKQHIQHELNKQGLVKQ